MRDEAFKSSRQLQFVEGGLLGVLQGVLPNRGLKSLRSSIL
jgi:hypothetical protein